MFDFLRRNPKPDKEIVRKYKCSPLKELQKRMMEQCDGANKRTWGVRVRYGHITFFIYDYSINYVCHQRNVPHDLLKAHPVVIDYILDNYDEIMEAINTEAWECKTKDAQEIVYEQKQINRLREKMCKREN